MNSQKIRSVPHYSAYAFRAWLENQQPKFRGKNKDFVDRYLSDPLAPHSIGPKLPTVILNHIMRKLDQKSLKYKFSDVEIAWHLWNLWKSESEREFLTPEEEHGTWEGV